MSIDVQSSSSKHVYPMLVHNVAEIMDLRQEWWLWWHQSWRLEHVCGTWLQRLCILWLKEFRNSSHPAPSLFGTGSINKIESNFSTGWVFRESRSWRNRWRILRWRPSRIGRRGRFGLIGSLRLRHTDRLRCLRSTTSIHVVRPMIERTKVCKWRSR